MGKRSEARRSPEPGCGRDNGSTAGQDGRGATTGAPPLRAASHSRGGYFFFVVSIVGVVAVALLMYARSRASLRVKAVPSQAVILVDGEEHGQGEIGLRMLKAGSYRVEARLGSLQRERSIRLEPGDRKTLVIELRQGFLVGRSPSGPAVVGVVGDDQPLGVTPFGPVALWAGSSVLRFSLSGHIDRFETVTVAPGETAVVSTELQRGKGYLRAYVTPESASVLLDGRFLGQGPMVTSVLAAGKHLLEAKATGWTSSRESLSVGHGDTVRWEARLASVPMGWLSVSSTPSGAVVTLRDGTALGTAPIDSIALGPGPQTIRVEKAGFIPEELTVPIEAGVSVARDVRLSPEHGTRSLALNSRPTATVLLDGRMVGETPMVVQEVRTGVKHVLTLLSSDGRTWSTEFVMSPSEGGPYRVSHDFLHEGEVGQ